MHAVVLCHLIGRTHFISRSTRTAYESIGGYNEDATAPRPSECHPQARYSPSACPDTVQRALRRELCTASAATGSSRRFQHKPAGQLVIAAAPSRPFVIVCPTVVTQGPTSYRDFLFSTRVDELSTGLDETAASALVCLRAAGHLIGQRWVLKHVFCG